MSVTTALLLNACATTKLVNEWQAKGSPSRPYGNLLVIGIGNEEGPRRTFEDVFSASLGATGIQATPGYELLPSTRKVEEAMLLRRVKASGADAVLMSRLVRMENEIQYFPTRRRSAVDSFYDYYASDLLYLEPARIRHFSVAVMETNLWDASSQQLIWSGTTRTFQPGELRKEVAIFANLMIKTLTERGLIAARGRSPEN